MDAAPEQNLVTKYRFAKICDVTPVAIQNAVTRGEIELVDGKVDANAPKSIRYQAKDKKKNAKKGRGQVIREAAQRAFEGEGFDPVQKGVEDTRYKKAQADLKSLEYAEKLGVIIDCEAIQQKFGAFYDFLLNDLIYMPESIADIIWMKARASETPERAIEEELKTQISDVIEKAKRAAEAVSPPVDGAKYIMTSPDEGDVPVEPVPPVEPPVDGKKTKGKKA